MAVPRHRTWQLVALAAAAALMVVALTGGIRDETARAPRVLAARKHEGNWVKQTFAEAGVSYPPGQLLIRSFKKEGELEVWASSKKAGRLKKIWDVKVCSASGRLGPKRMRGDYQVPEGVYHIDRYNPWSNFHLSLGVNYPNKSDRIRGRAKGSKDLGGDIFIHGDCVTIGCIPIEDQGIERLFLAALDTHRAGLSRVPVHIFPARLDADGLAALKASYPDDAERIALWDELARVYEAFEETRTVPAVTIDKRGAYVVP